MGNREDLISAAKQCLLDKGYARTTARDIASAAGVSLAAIGYHFGSKDALMNQAVYETIGDWGDATERAMAAEGSLDDTGRDRFEAVLERTIASFGGEARKLWAVQMEIMTLLVHNEELRAFLASVQTAAATGLAKLYLGLPEDGDPEKTHPAGHVLHALTIGMFVKWFMDPERFVAPKQIAEGLRIIADSIVDED